MTARADNPAATATRRRVASAPAAKPPSSQGLAEFTSALQGGPRCGCASAVAAPIAMPMPTAAAIGRAASGSRGRMSRIRLNTALVDVAFGECARAQDSRIVTTLSEVAGVRPRDGPRAKGAPLPSE